MTPASTPLRSWRRRVGEAVLLLLVSAAMLWLTLALVPGVSIEASGASLVATLVIALASAVVRPLLAAFATTIGWLGVVLTGLAAQGLIFYVALSIAPDVSLSGFWSAFWASWLYALLVGCVGWLLDAGDDELFVADVLRGAQHGRKPVPTSEPGVVFIQIDGLSEPLFHWAVQAGGLPTLASWLRSGTHRPIRWQAQLPPTTPASQAGILHGRSDAVPAFRWYEKEAGRLTVTNHPVDAAHVERGLSNGRGLLADGGVSIGNIFSGDATRALLTISADPGRAAPSRRFAAAYLRPFGFTRALVLSVGEMAKELHQGRRQRLRGVEPRIDRRSSYVLLRAMTNVVLRDVNVRLLAEEMLQGTPVMYCDFTDYDEVAHHAGPMRPESIASLAGVDRALGALARIAAAAPRPYELVVLSDHGQSQGATFRQRCGESLEEVVRRYADDSVRIAGPGGSPSTASTDSGEAWGPVAAFLAAVGRGRGLSARLSRQIKKREAGDDDKAAAAAADIVVAASGNLAFVYFTELPGRALLEEMQAAYPGLVARLVRHESVGYVVARTAQHGLVAIGRDGSHFLDEGRVEGVDPLAVFGPDAAADVRRHAALAHVGDLVVNSCVDEATGEVAAFEELVGCHGGLGGWQTEAVLVYPTQWSPPGALVGADAVHHQLVGWLTALGLRADAQSDPPPVATADALAAR